MTTHKRRATDSPGEGPNAPDGADAGDYSVDAVDGVDAIVAQWGAVRPDLDTGAMAVYGRIYRIARLMGDQQEKVYERGFGINRGDFDVLATLRRSGEPYTLSPRELSAALMLTTGGMTGRLDRLENAGLLRRAPDPHDRRGLRVTLTEEGFRIVDGAVEAGLHVQQRAMAALTGREAAQLADLLRRLLAASE